MRRATFAALAALLLANGLAAAAATGPRGSTAALDSLDELLRSPRPAAAESLATLLLRRAENARPPDSTLMARALHGIGWARWNRKALRDTIARTALERSLRIESARRAPDSMAMGLSEHALARVLLESGRPDSSLSHFGRALALLVPRRSETDSVVAWTWLSLGIAQVRLRQPSDALESLEHGRSLMARRNGERSAQVAFALTEVGGALAALGRIAETRDTLELVQSINQRALGPDDPRHLNSLALLANLEYQSGDIGSAIEALERGLAVAIRSYGDQDVHTQPFRANISMRLMELGEFDEAQNLMRLALASFETTYGADNFRSVAARTHVGVTEALAGDSAAARRDLEAAYQSVGRAGSDPNTVAVPCLRWLSYLANERGEHGAAQRLLDAAFAAERASGNPEFEQLAALFELQQSVERDANDLAGLANTVRGIDSLASDTARVSSLGYRMLLRARAMAHERLGHQDAAWRDALRAEEIDRDRLRLNTRALPDRQALAMSGNTLQSLDLLVHLSVSRGHAARRAAWDRLIRWRGLVAAEIARRRAPPDVGYDSVQTDAHTRWIAAQQRLARSMVAGAGDSDSATVARLARLQDAAETAERDYTRLVPARAVAPAELSAGLDEVLARLAPDAGLVGVCELDAATDTARVLAFVARGSDRQVSLVDLGPSAELRGPLDRWLAALSAPPRGAGARAAEAECRRLGAPVRKQTFDRIAAAMGPSREWFVIGDGPLLELPWQALPDGASRYLVESGPLLHGLDAERELLAPTDSPKSRGLLAVGGPQFDAARSPTANVPLAFASRGPLGDCGAAAALAPLPAARAEAEEAGRIWNAAHPEAPAVVLVGDAASEEEFDRQAPGRQVVHLATHGIVWGDSCAATVRDLTALRGVGGVEELAVRPAARRPAPAAVDRKLAPPSRRLGRQTWLALAGANHARGGAAGGEDGLLTAQEVMTLDLRSVDWVVLSACQSGAGETWPHEGAEGMRRAFRLAGARTVIASQWSLADEPAREWMRELYAARVAGATDAGSAMRSASRAFLAARRAGGRTTHPFYWASFIASGR